MNWDDYRFFLAVARRRTLSAAARELAVTQPTVGRRIAALERRLGAKLYVRRPDGFVLSDAGGHLLEHAERIEREVLAAEVRVFGRDAGLRGVVRMTASEWMCTSVLSPLLGDLVVRHPQLEIELLADPRHLNLARREADLALRPRRFEHQAILQRAIGRLTFGLYAAPRYLATRGTPRDGDGQGHVVIGMLDGIGDVMREWLTSALPRATRSVRTNGRDAMVGLATAGVGLACLARVVGDRVSALQHVPLATPPPAPMLWLGVHRDARTTPRVRAVAGYVAEQLRARLG
ncbi:MAG TPA: LysR family transcriptional regulator [Kofleriaceae bacterium]|nr:LysR family transcriptional regulator [Kofleriaceae bacterium]